METLRGIPHSPVVRSLHSHCWEPGSIPGQPTKISQTAQHDSLIKINSHWLSCCQAGRKSFFLLLGSRKVVSPSAGDAKYSSISSGWDLYRHQGVFAWGFPSGSDHKESACNAGDPSLILGSGRSPGEGNGKSLQYSCLGNPMDRGAWWATVLGVAKSWAWLSDWKTVTKYVHESTPFWPPNSISVRFPFINFHTTSFTFIANHGLTKFSKLSVESSQLLGLCICISSPWSLLIFPNSCHPGIVPPKKSKVLRLCLDLPKKVNVKECSNYCTIAPISHASKVMLKILQARLQQ